MQETLGKRISRLRLAKGLSVASLAKATGTHAEVIYRWQNDKNKPQDHHLERLAQVLGVTKQELLGGESNGKSGEMLEQFNRLSPEWQAFVKGMMIALTAGHTLRNALMAGAFSYATVAPLPQDVAPFAAPE